MTAIRALRRPSRPGPALAVLLAAWFWLLAGAGAALAHASLAASEPADGAVVAEAPEAVSLTFSELVSPLVMRLVAPDGRARDLDAVSYSGNTLRIQLPGGMADGTHVLSWRVVSEDGHPVGGSVVFSIGAASASPAAGAGEAIDRTLLVFVWSGRLVLYLGFAFGVGGVFAVSWFGRPGGPGSDLAAAFAIAGLVATIVSTGLQGLDALARPLADIASAEVWRAGLDTRFGVTALGLLVAFAASLMALASSGVAARLWALAGLVVAAGAFAASGHAGSAPPQWLMRPMVALHAAGAAVWLGALPPLALGLGAGDADATRLLARFSRTIPAVLAVLLAAGAVLAAVQVETPAALVDRAYGRVLLVKLALVAVLLAVAAVNRWWFTGRVAEGDAGAARAMLRLVVAETVLAILILAAVAAWRFTPPPRALAAAEPAWVHLHDARAMADLTLTPGRTGVTAATIALQGGDYGPLAAKAVTLVLSRPDAGIEPIRREASTAGQGTWAVPDLVVPLAGRWEVRVDVLVSDFEIVWLRGEIEVRR